MYSIINAIKKNQFRFFKYYYVVIVLIIVWSLVEGVGDIRGELSIVENKVVRTVKFSAGYLTSLNYGIYYLAIMPLFLRAIFNTYSHAEKLSDMTGDNVTDPVVHLAVKEYSSNIINFLKKKWAIGLFFGLLLVFSIQNIYVQVANYHTAAIGWVQGRNLRLLWDQHQTEPGKGPLILKQEFYYQSTTTSDFVVKKSDSTIVNNLGFSFSGRVPKEAEFILFVIFARFLTALFCAVVFFFNFNILYGIYQFFKAKNREFLFKSELFAKTMDRLISSISLAGFTLTIFLFFRFLANAQKGSFQQFAFNSIHSDQYVFFLGVIFIPVSSIVLFSYVFSAGQTIDFKTITFRNLISFYIPNIAFFLIFFVYLLNFDPYLERQLQFISGIVQAINKSVMP